MSDTKKKYVPKSGLILATVSAINPTPEEIEQLTGRPPKFTPEYTGVMDDGLHKASFQIWLKDTESGHHHVHRFNVLNGLRVSKADPTNVQWVNNGLSLVWGRGKRDVEEKNGRMFEEFRKRPYRQAFIGEENLCNFLYAWYLQGGWMKDGEGIDLDWEMMFAGDFRDIQALIPKVNAQKNGNTVSALCVIRNEKEAIWKQLAPGWWMGDLLGGNSDKPSVRKWLEDLKGPYGCKDAYVLAPYGKAAPTGATSDLPF